MSQLMQSAVWTTREGETLRLEEMENGHRANLLRYIWRNIESFRFKLGWYWAIVVDSHDGGDMAHYALEREAEEAETAPADQLFLSLPLVRRLLELTPDVTGIPTKEEAR